MYSKLRALPGKVICKRLSGTINIGCSHSSMPILKLIAFMTGPRFWSVILLSLVISPILANEPVTVNSGKNQTALLELYTSEGCSSCPPADRWFNQLIKVSANELDVLALSFHVDYWDYIGWKDIYANPAYTTRQRRLARINQQSTVYTPEFFVNGIEARGTQSVLEKISSTNKLESDVGLKLSFHQQKNKILLQLSSEFDSKQNPLVRFVVYENNLTSDVKRGENAGKTFNHQRVVRFLSPRQKLQPEISYSINVDSQWNVQNLGVAALVQTKNGEFLQTVYSQLSQ